MDRLEAMATLLAIVQTGSLSAAARRLDTPLTTVSRRISALEAHLKTQVLNRSSRRVMLTDVGQIYIQSCRRILDEVEEAERTVSGEYSAPKGELVVAASTILGRQHVVPVTAEFLSIYPDITLRLRLSDRVVDLFDEHVDLGIRIGPLPDSSLIARRLGFIRRVICASPEYLARCGLPQVPVDISGHDCITMVPSMRPDSWDFPVEKSVSPVPVRSRLMVDTADAAVAAAVAGAGITCVYSFHAAEAVRAGKLVLLLQAFEQPPIPVSIVHLGGGILPLKVRAFLDFAVPALKARLTADLT